MATEIGANIEKKESGESYLIDFQIHKTIPT